MLKVSEVYKVPMSSRFLLVLKVKRVPLVLKVLKATGPPDLKVKRVLLVIKEHKVPDGAGAQGADRTRYSRR